MSDLTTREPECELTELPVSMCDHCREHRSDDEESDDALHWFPARFPGRCAECDERITPGDEIAHTSDGYVCRECGE